MLLDAQPVIPLCHELDELDEEAVRQRACTPTRVTIHAWKYVYIEHDPAKWIRADFNYVPIHRRRLIVTVPMVLVVVSLTWGLIRLAPGNFYTGEKAIPPAIEKNLREKYGLDRPWYVQYGKMLIEHAARRFRIVAEVSGTVGQRDSAAGACRCRPRSGCSPICSRSSVGIVVGHACGAATELAARLRVDGVRDARNLAAEFRARPDPRAAVRR